MIRTITVYEIFCDGCQEEISAPRAQDYWESLDQAAHEGSYPGFGCWTYTPERQLCWSCTENDA